MLLGCLLAAITTVPAVADVVPYGVCAHLGGGQEFAAHEQELQLMEEAGIRWARADFTWGYFERTQGQWKFDNYDAIVAAAKRHNVTLLPILCYNVDWAFPAHEHLEQWCNYVRTVAARYQKDLPYWEVWNEPNIEFWKPKPDPAQYAALLKATYAAIKEVNPDLQVVYGGTAGVPLEFIRKTFELGALQACDVLAIHPYNYPTAPEQAGNIVKNIPAVRKLMEEFGGEKPLWITEFGWPTHISKVTGDGSLPAQFILHAAKLRFPGRDSFPMAVLYEKGAPFSGELSFVVRDGLARLPGVTPRLVGLAELKDLKPSQTPVLVLPVNELYPADYFDALLAYVRDGGLLVHLGGVPFYYASRLKEGKWESPGAGEGARQALHVGWKAWWTEKGLPERASRAELLEPAPPGLKLPPNLESTRWLTDSRLQGNDKFIPLVAAYNGNDLIGYPVALYLYDSDLKGGFLSLLLSMALTGVTEDTQGVYLPRALITSYSLGVDNIFWYEFRDGGDDATYNEHRFGIIHNDLSPKPAYTAYQTLTRSLGAGKFLQSLDLGTGNFGYVFDTGTSKTAALWCAEGQSAVRLVVSGARVAACDYLGRPVAITITDGVATVPLCDKVTYLTGLDSVAPRP